MTNLMMDCRNERNGRITARDERRLAKEVRETGRDERSAGANGRYERFEPITVRASARVLQLQRAGLVTPREARFYLSELLAMDAHAGPGAFGQLLRAARSRCA